MIPTPMLRRPSRRGTTAACALALLLVPLGAAAAAGDDGGDTQLGGYTITAEGSPLAMLLFEPVMPVPVDPGQPHFELQSAYTMTRLGSGPSGRALASWLWPGALFGDGLEQIIPDQHYPIRSDARYPAGPQQDELEVVPGTGMRTRAEGLEVEARSAAAESPVLELFAGGAYESRSWSRVVDDEAVARARSTAKDVVLLGGVVEVDSVVSDVRAISDGRQGRTDGTTTVEGLRIGGQGFVVDQDGVRPVEDDAAGDSPLPFGVSGRTPDELREALGIRVEVLEHAEDLDGSRAGRTAAGLRIVVDTGVLRGAIDDPVLQPVIGNLPDLVVDPPVLGEHSPVTPYPLLFAQPEIELHVGRAVVSSHAVPPLDLDFDLDLGTPPPPADVAPPPPLEEQAAPEPPAAADAPAPDLADDADAAAQPDPQIADEGQEVLATDARSLPDSPGVGIGVALLGLAGGAVAARGLHGMTGLVFGAAGGCETGGARAVPDLREG